jgi:hypothetical protein
VQALRIVSLLFLLTASGAAHAQFRQTSFRVSDFTSLECGIVGSTDRDWRVQVYKIAVSITLDSNDHHLKELYVAHYATDGSVYVRSEQYPDGHIWQNGTKHDWFWNGHLNRGTMEGEVWHSVDGRWLYSEKRFNSYGQLEYRMLSACHDLGE